MTLSEKILTLRKGSGMSQEELSEKLDVSRQAISRWEMGAAMPDVTNVRDCLIVVLYLLTALFITWKIEKHYKTAA